MLHQTTNTRQEEVATKDKPIHTVNCFVCKREVQRDQAKQILHSREKKVWVCETHIKQ